MAATATQSFTLNATLRQNTGKEKAKKLRAAGEVPAIMYGGHAEPVSLTLSEHEMVVLLQALHGDTSVIDVKVEGGESAEAYIKDVQREPVKNKILHVDLLRITRGETIYLSVPIHIENRQKCAGVKAGGLIEQVLHEVEVSGFPRDIPGHIEIDMTDIQLNQAIHVSDLPRFEGVTYINEASATVISVVPKDKDTATAASPETGQAGLGTEGEA
ncbi:MAG: 50S ribosomal protein L25 [Sumerlaeia bacterium]